jgi:hypothetical protein
MIQGITMRFSHNDAPKMARAPRVKRIRDLPITIDKLMSEWARNFPVPPKRPTTIS